MSGGYNDRLKPIAWKGECGDKETEEPRAKWTPKAAQLAQWIKDSKHTVAFTGAGISCASGIPDFRGPKGVWTLEKKGEKPQFDVPFEKARPSFTHMALVALMNHGHLHYIVSQNVDGLHLRSGVPRAKLSELHGNIFAEFCDRCQTEYVRDFDIADMGCKPTGRICDNGACGGPLRGMTIDWDSPLPDAEFERAIDNHKQADLAICLGTSLRIRPAGNMPLRTLRKHGKDAPGRLVIVNLQKTHCDRSASMRFHVRTDALMREVCAILGVPVDHDDKEAAAMAAAAAAAEDEKHAAAQAAAAASPPVARKARQPSELQAIGRPTRRNTERLRQLYNPNAIKREQHQLDDDEGDSEIGNAEAAAVASSSSAAAAASPAAASSHAHSAAAAADTPPMDSSSEGEDVETAAAAAVWSPPPSAASSSAAAASMSAAAVAAASSPAVAAASWPVVTSSNCAGVKRGRSPSPAPAAAASSFPSSLSAAVDPSTSQLSKQARLEEKRYDAANANAMQILAPSPSQSDLTDGSASPSAMKQA